MANYVSAFCKNYFEGFKDIANFKNNNLNKNIFGIVKITSYATLIMPLFFGILYGTSSLAGRVVELAQPESVIKRVQDVYIRIFNPTIEQQLTSFFNASSKKQKLFNIEEQQIGIIYNPTGKAVTDKQLRISDSIAIISNKSIPDKTLNIIIKYKPTHCSYSTVTSAIINSLTPLQYYGF